MAQSKAARSAPVWPPEMIFRIVAPACPLRADRVLSRPFRAFALPPGCGISCIISAPAALRRTRVNEAKLRTDFSTKQRAQQKAWLLAVACAGGKSGFAAQASEKVSSGIPLSPDTLAHAPTRFRRVPPTLHFEVGTLNLSLCRANPGCHDRRERRSLRAAPAR